MIEFVFTLNYELDAAARGRLAELAYAPAETLRAIFEKRGLRFVAFVEAVELETIRTLGTDPGIDLVEWQLRQLHQQGFEIGLHLHPEWCNGRFTDGCWRLDSNERNLCTLDRDRVTQIVDGSLAYLRHVLDQPRFTPLSFRARRGQFQPCQTAASVLGERGLKVDSSVFRDVVQSNPGLDDRPMSRSSHYWTFTSDASQEDPEGTWVEVPIHTHMAPFWTRIRHSRTVGSFRNGLGASARQKVKRLRDSFRLRYPRTLDFCRSPLQDLIAMTEAIVKQDRVTPERYRPIVAIGHTPDLTDSTAIDGFLSFLEGKGIAVVTFDTVYSRVGRHRFDLAAIPRSEPTPMRRPRDTGLATRRAG
jgi:hypothetical protein